MKRRHVIHPVRVRDGTMSQVAIHRVDAADERRLAFAGFLQTEIREEFDIAISNVGQGLRGGARIGRGHVRDAVVNDSLFHVNRVEVRRRARRFHATALVDRNVDDNAAGPHRAKHFARDQLRRLRPRHEHGADQEIDRWHQLCEMRLAGVKGVRRMHRDIEEPHPLEIDL